MGARSDLKDNYLLGADRFCAKRLAL